MNTALITRPWSCHRPRVPGYEPAITSRIVRVSRSKHNAWRLEVLIDGTRMYTSHHDTKGAAESRAAPIMEAYCAAHYKST